MEWRVGGVMEGGHGCREDPEAGVDEARRYPES